MFRKILKIGPHGNPPPLLSYWPSKNSIESTSSFQQLTQIVKMKISKLPNFVTDTATFTDHTNWYKKGPGKPANFRFQKSGERGRVSQVDGQVGEGGQVCPVTTCWEGKRCPTLACSCPALCGHFTFHWPIRSSLSPYLSLSIISTLKFPLLNLCMHLFCACSIVQEVHFTPTMKFVLVNYEHTHKHGHLSTSGSAFNSDTYRL